MNQRIIHYFKTLNYILSSSFILISFSSLISPTLDFIKLLFIFDNDLFLLMFDFNEDNSPFNVFSLLNKLSNFNFCLYKIFFIF